MSEIKIYNVHDLEKILGVTQRTIYNYIKAGQLKAVKIGGSWRFTEEALADFLEHGTETNYLEKRG